MKINHLLLTTDFSENARKTYRCGADLARKFSAKLHLAHFTGLAPPVALGSSVEDFYEASRQALVNEAGSHEAFEGLEVETHLETHRWTPARLRAIEEEHEIDLVVMGTHGHTGLKRFVMGSFAERMVRNSSAPVLVSRQEESQATFDPKVVLVPIDFSELTEAIVPTIQFLASNFGCRFRFLYVYEPMPAKHYPIFEAVREFLHHTPKQPIESRFDELVTGQLSGVEATLETCQGVPSVEIVNHVAESNADLVLLGTHGVLGSVAQNVTREASCSVLTVPLNDA